MWLQTPASVSPGCLLTALAMGGGQSPPSSPQCEDGISAQRGHGQESPSLAEPQHWAEQLGGSGPTGYSKTDKI
ncbi:hypothetical protein VZT92_007481 [Zoarces viviparus]|uniref:Uncharacterized protein n=1 Tax=Zoarces viviparus TaxID=48416 RepID=A0AAW1FK28_ZOAVI